LFEHPLLPSIRYRYRINNGDKKILAFISYDIAKSILQTYTPL
jgi:hypothetical protein